MIKHIIFDFDGVVADSFDINWPLSKDHDETATMEDFLAHHDGNVYAEPRIKFREERVHEFWTEYRRQLTPGHLADAIGPIKRFDERYSMYIVSSTSEEIMKGVMEKAGILSLFAAVMGHETHKSKVEKFKMLMDQYDVTSDNSIFVTDTLGDIKEANKVGIKTIAETFGYHPRERLLLGDPFKIADSWSQIEEMVGGL
ncbi:MAG: HAD hydrolase-like protein [Minisyncoccia bacterium]